MKISYNNKITPKDMDKHITQKFLSIFSATFMTLAVMMPSIATASSWSPTLLVNTESFQVIDDGDESTDIELRFGDSVNEKLFWDIETSRFEFTDDVHVQGNLTASGTITVTGSATLGGTVTIGGVTYTFPGSDGSGTGKVLKTDGSGNLSWSNDNNSGGFTFAELNSWFINDNGGTMTGNLIIDGANLEALTVSGAQVHARDVLTSSGTLKVTGNANIGGTVTLNGVTYNYPASDGSASGKVLKTDGSGNLSWSTDIDTDTDTNTTYTPGNGLNLNGTTFQLNSAITGATLDTTGNITTNANLTINADNGDADAVLTFGNDAAAKAITYSNTNTRFEFNDDVKTTGNLSGSTLTIDGNVTLRGQTYAFPTNEGSSGSILKTDGSGNLQWATDAGPGSGDILFMQPEYANAVYFASGATAVGTLAMSGSTFDNENYYVWNSTKGTIQDYWISARVRVPENFSSWDPVKAIEYRYKTKDGTAGTNHTTVRLLDTAGSEVSLTGNAGLANAAWTTAAITGPEAGGTYTPGGYLTVYVKLATTSSGWASAGYLEFNWETRR